MIAPATLALAPEMHGAARREQPCRRERQGDLGVGPAEHPAHLNLQISLLAEQETTKVLQRLKAIAEHLEIRETKADEEIERLSQSTHLEVLAEELKRSLPED